MWSGCLAQFPNGRNVPGSNIMVSRGLSFWRTSLGSLWGLWFLPQPKNTFVMSTGDYIRIRIKGDKHVWVCMVVLCSLCNGWTICPKYPFLTYDTSNRPHPTQNIELDKWLRKWMNGVQNSFKIHKCIFREYICHLQNLLGNPKLCNLILLTTFWT